MRFSALLSALFSAVLSALLFVLLFALLLRLQSGGQWGEEKTPSDRALRCPGGSGQGVCI